MDKELNKKLIRDSKIMIGIGSLIVVMLAVASIYYVFVGNVIYIMLYGLLAFMNVCTTKKCYCSYKELKKNLLEIQKSEEEGCYE